MRSASLSRMVSKQPAIFFLNPFKQKTVKNCQIVTIHQWWFAPDSCYQLTHIRLDFKTALEQHQAGDNIRHGVPFIGIQTSAEAISSAQAAKSSSSHPHGDVTSESTKT